MEMISTLDYYDKIKDYNNEQLLEEKARLEKLISEEENGGNLADYGLSISGSEAMLSSNKEYLIIVESLIKIKKKEMEGTDTIDTFSYAQKRFEQVFVDKNSREFYAMARRVIKSDGSFNNNYNIIDWYICDYYLLLADNEMGFVQYPVSFEKTSEIKRYIQNMNNINDLNSICEYLNEFKNDKYNLDYKKNTFFETCINGVTIGFPCDNNSDFLKNLYSLICKICNIDIKSSNTAFNQKDDYTESTLKLINEIDKKIEKLNKEQEAIDHQKVLDIMSRDYISIDYSVDPLNTTDEIFKNNINYLIDLTEEKIYIQKSNELEFIKVINDVDKNKIINFIKDNNLLYYKIDNPVMVASGTIEISINGVKNTINNASAEFTDGKIRLFDDFKKLIVNIINECDN